MTMVAAEKSSAAQLRAANYYLHKLDQLNLMYQSGGENVLYALHTFDQEWQQIRRWRSWIVDHATNDSAIGLACARLPLNGKEILQIRLTAQEHLEWLNASLESSLRLGDQALIAENLLQLGAKYEVMGDIPTSIEAIQQVFRHVPEESNTLVIGNAYYALGSAEYARGKLEQARLYFLKSIEIFEVYHDVLMRAEAQHRLAGIAGQMGDYALVVQLLGQALTIFERFGKVMSLASCYNQLGLVARFQGDLGLSIEYLEKSLELYETLNYRTGIAKALGNLASILTMTSQSERAETIAKRSLTVAEEVNDPRMIIAALIQLGRMYIADEDPTPTRTYLKQALALAESINYPYAIAACTQMLGISMMRHAEFDEAEIYLQRGLEVARQMQHTPNIVYQLSGLTDTYGHQHKFQAAKAALYEAVTLVAQVDLVSKMEVLRTGIDLWNKRDQLEPAVRWFGLLRSLDEIENVSFNLQRLEPLLRAKVDAAQFEAWVAQGATLDLDEALAELSAQLEAGQG